MNRRLAVFGAAVALDLACGELPTRVHPVAWLGRGSGALGRCLPRGAGTRDLRSGLALAAVIPALAVALAVTARRGASRWGRAPGFAAEVFLLKQTFAVRALFEHVAAVRRPLAMGALDDARAATGRIVGRDISTLDAPSLASAAIESLAENASDSAVAPWMWYAVGGLPGAVAYRAINTLDATVGYRHFGSFGLPSARLDDVANVVPARLTAACIALASSAPAAAARGAIRDARNTPSPNSGWPMAAAAHALDVRLEKHGHHVLNAGGRAPSARDIARAGDLIARALVIAGAFFAIGLTLRGSR